MSVHLVEASDHIMGSFDEKLITYTTRLLENRKVCQFPGRLFVCLCPASNIAPAMPFTYVHVDVGHLIFPRAKTYAAFVRHGKDSPISQLLVNEHWWYGMIFLFEHRTFHFPFSLLSPPPTCPACQPRFWNPPPLSLILQHSTAVQGGR